MYNIAFLKYFINVNMKWVCLCRVHIFAKAMNEILFGNDNEEKKTSDFLIFADENLGDFFKWISYFGLV